MVGQLHIYKNSVFCQGVGVYESWRVELYQEMDLRPLTRIEMTGLRDGKIPKHGLNLIGVRVTIGKT